MKSQKGPTSKSPSRWSKYRQMGVEPPVFKNLEAVKARAEKKVGMKLSWNRFFEFATSSKDNWVKAWGK